jgi:hypothetical protein
VNIETLLTDLVNSILDTAGISKAWWRGGALLTLCHVLNIVLMKNKEKTPYEEWFRENLHYLSCAHGVV